MSNYLLSLHVNYAARKSSLKNVSESGQRAQPHCAEWVGSLGCSCYAWCACLVCCAVTLSFLHHYFQLVCMECMFGVLCSYPIIFASLFSVVMRGVPVQCVVQLPYHFCIIIFCCYACSACSVCCVDTLSFLHRYFVLVVFHRFQSE